MRRELLTLTAALLTAAVLTAAVLIATVLPGPSASAASSRVNQVYLIPAKGRITIVGHGYGHGHGMSQYGAEGAARKGLSWRQIVSFYYPGTTTGRRHGKVRVLIGADTSRDVIVSPRHRLKILDTGTGKITVLPRNGARLWRINVNPRGKTVIGFRTNRWHRWRALRGEGVFTAAGKPIRLHHDHGTTLYRGQLASARPTGSRDRRDRDTINILTLENYVKGVLPREVPASWSPAAVRAQAVAARTYAAYEINHRGKSHYQLCDTTQCQVYGGYDAEHPLANRAVNATRFQILRHRGAAAFTQFSSSSGGWTTANQFPYLPAKRDPYDAWPGNANHRWSMKINVARIERAWGIGNLKSIRVTRRDGHGQWRGRIERMQLRGPKKTVTISGDELRSVLGLKSTWVNFRR
ncbi:MAG: SpoIID/LytB domain-containing protein [Nocardioides sp.]|nr:SpoIID/LytB domain-containing protein [Nocardioides sp.]